MVAKMFLNFNFFLKNIRKGFEIRHNRSEIHKYKMTVCILYKKYNPTQSNTTVPRALSIPFEIVFDVIITIQFCAKDKKKLAR